MTSFYRYSSLTLPIFLSLGCVSKAVPVASEPLELPAGITPRDLAAKTSLIVLDSAVVGEEMTVAKGDVQPFLFKINHVHYPDGTSGDSDHCTAQGKAEADLLSDRANVTVKSISCTDKRGEIRDYDVDFLVLDTDGLKGLRNRVDKEALFKEKAEASKDTFKDELATRETYLSALKDSVNNKIYLGKEQYAYLIPVEPDPLYFLMK